jgi:Tfp pilus assembly protein PilX
MSEDAAAVAQAAAESAGREAEAAARDAEPKIPDAGVNDVPAEGNDDTWRPPVGDWAKELQGDLDMADDGDDE